MASTRMKPKLIWVRFQQVAGDRVMAISDDLPGLLVAGASTEEIRPTISRAIEELFQAAGCEVKVEEIETGEGGKERESFVAIPSPDHMRGDKRDSVAA